MEEGIVLPHSSRVQIWESQGGRKWLKTHTLAIRSGNQMDAGTQPAGFLLVISAEDPGPRKAVSTQDESSHLSSLTTIVFLKCVSWSTLGPLR